LQHIRDSAGPGLDFVDFMASQTVVSLDFVAELAKVPEFSAAVSAFRSRLPLGYCGFFCWPAVRNLFRPIAEEPLLDYLRVAAYCSELPAHNGRHIDLDDRSAKRGFPVVFRIDDFQPGPERSAYISALLAGMGSFAARHPFRAAGFASVKSHDEDEYVDWWIGRSEPQIAKYLQDPRFCAGLDAFGQELLSFHGFLEKVFGLDYYDNVLSKNQYALFQDLRSDLTGRVIVRLANQVLAGERPIAPGLRERFPELYVGYQPELYGARR
jgi:hypothetical protein